MAFPTTSVLSSFTGADESPLSEGGAWSGPMQSGQTQLRRLSNTAQRMSTGTGPGQSYRSAGTFGADSEAYATITTLPSSGNGVAVWCRLQNPGNSTTAKAILGVYTTGTGWRVFEFTSGATFTQKGTTNSTAAAAGDKIGLEVIGSNVVLKHYTGGAWVDRVTTTTAVSGSGYIGAEVSATTGALDDFGGGTVVTATSTASYRMLLGVG